jgi:hypothetical protein
MGKKSTDLFVLTVPTPKAFTEILAKIPHSLQQSLILEISNQGRKKRKRGMGKRRGEGERVDF